VEPRPPRRGAAAAARRRRGAGDRRSRSRRSAPFRPLYSAAWLGGHARQAGPAASVDDAQVASLAEQLLALLQTDRVDHTSFFRALGPAARGDAEPARRHFLDLAGIDAWLDRWRALAPDPELLDRTNPVYVPRNHLVEQALGAAVDGDLAPLDRLLEAVTAPYDERPGLERYAEPDPEQGVYTTFCGT
jgi:uncharacterized protein YdiU (UPF0061 family)